MGNLGSLSPEGSVAVSSSPTSLHSVGISTSGLANGAWSTGWGTCRVDLDQSPGHRVDAPAQVAYPRRRKTSLRHSQTAL